MEGRKRYVKEMPEARQPETEEADKQDTQNERKIKSTEVKHIGIETG